MNYMNAPELLLPRSEEGHNDDTGRSQGDRSARQTGAPATVPEQWFLAERIPHLP